MKKFKHSPNCDCYDCARGDSYLTELRSRFGKNANFTGAANRPQSFNDYDANHADETVGTKADVKAIFGDALGGILGDLAQKKKEGQVLPKALDTVAGLVIKTEKAAVSAATKSAESEIGAQVLQKSPYILAGIGVAVLVVMYLLFKGK